MTDTSNVVRLVEQSRDQTLPLHEQHAAFTRLVEQSQHLVFSLALASLRDVDDAKDAAQESFATAWLRLSQLRDASAFSAWLKAIVATQCNRRRRGHRPSESELLEFHGSGEKDTHRLDYQSLIASALASLPRGERDVMVLFYFLGYTQREIARLLHLKPGTGRQAVALGQAEGSSLAAAIGERRVRSPFSVAQVHRERPARLV
jgi:RNA polymerase sigma-70 factor (ECF subfamily)